MATNLKKTRSLLAPRLQWYSYPREIGHRSRRPRRVPGCQKCAQRCWSTALLFSASPLRWSSRASLSWSSSWRCSIRPSRRAVPPPVASVPPASLARPPPSPSPPTPTPLPAPAPPPPRPCERGGGSRSITSMTSEALAWRTAPASIASAFMAGPRRRRPSGRAHTPRSSAWAPAVTQ